ncbi:hypothetical protein [Ascidiaceihabitans sp.]|uniref:hypothetical protein n=1 Tax=Ascidiaceihabitans sp. TaxID=1872644 RepID=UPI003297994F
MTRVAVIGTSHVAALKLAWDEIGGRYPHIEAEHFGMNRARFLKTSLRPDMTFGLPDDMRCDDATPRRLRGLVDLSTFDVVWHVGGWTCLQAPMRELCVDYNIDGFGTSGHAHCMSQATFHACLDAITTKAMPDKAWHNWTPGRLFFSTVPRRNEIARQDALYHTAEPHCFKQVWDTADQHLDARMSAVAIQRVPQPKCTLDAYGFTKQDFGTEKPVSTGGLVDTAHMNTAFGARMWDAFLARVQA